MSAMIICDIKLLAEMKGEKCHRSNSLLQEESERMGRGGLVEGFVVLNPLRTPFIMYMVPTFPFQKLSNKIWHTVSPFNLFTSFVFIVILRVSIALSELEADTT